MIVREIIEHEELIESFDWFNDSDDTISWLMRFGEVHEDLIAKLKAGFRAYIRMRTGVDPDANKGT